ncbi:FG-GAP-like repeat-containing protein [Streptomyces leeuwenhoekii]|uniref:Secreted Protein n=3 Tax=Streptomyces leeuwenhoekii TaxID=1437453 RepID=A0A0F7W1M7_STRLW|nr:FG-GAP-like repeat-containing protein [Streptomyces leeuwenhoekii]CQR62801.1 Secreted Protein [Streptomyces leeuwenhoekii]
MGNRFTRSVATLAGLVLAGTGLAAVNAAPAAADVYDCPAGYFCGWSGESATGQMYKTNKSVADLGAWNDKIRSHVNRTTSIACVYEDKDYVPWGGYFAEEPAGAGEYSSYPTATTSSIKFVRTARECSQDAYPRWTSETSPKALGFGDMNGDRKADVIARDKAGRLWFTPGDGTGRLIGSGGWNAMNALARHGDFSGDGREDVIAREASTGKLWLYPGTGTGTLGARKLIGTGGWNAMSRITAVGDLSGDGRSDLMAVEKATGKLYLYPGTSAGSLGARKLLGTGGWNAMNALAGVGDANGDGRPDLYAREASTGKLWLYPGRTGALGARVLVGTGGWNAMDDLIAVGDFSGDGRPDLAAVSNEKYAIDGYVGHPGWLLTYRGQGNGLLASGERTDGEWWGLNGFC